MRKNLFYYLFAVICSVSLVTACSDDDDEDTTWQQIPEVITPENTTLKLNDKTPANATAALDITNGESGKLTLTNLIYGHPTVNVDVTLQKKDDTSYNFTGTADLAAAKMAASNPALKVTVSGTVDVNGKLNVAVATSGWAAANGVYDNDSLAVTVAGQAQASTYAVTLVAVEEGKANLTFQKIVNVANDFEMEVSLKDGKIEGSKDKAVGYSVNVTGNLVAGKLTLAVTTTGWATISGTYNATGNKITYNGAELPDGTYFTINVTAENKAEISFSNLLSGSRSGVIKDAVVSAKDNVYTIKGKNEATGYTLSFEGTVDAEHILTATASYVTASPIVGTWAPKLVSTPTGNMVATDVKFETNKGAVTFDKKIIEMLPAELKPMFAETMPDANVSQVLQGLLGTYAVYLKSLTFAEDGRLVVKYVDMPKDINGDGKIDANDIVAGADAEQTFALLQYYISNDKLYLTVNMNDLMGLIPTATNRAAWDPGTVLTEGIPLNMSVNGSTALISIDQGVLNAATVEFVNGLLGMFGPMIPGFAEQTELINTVMGALTSILSDTKTLSAGMYLEKSTK